LLSLDLTSCEEEEELIVKKNTICEENFALQDAVGSHACWLEVSMRVTNTMPLESPMSY
jgi:hypothetical protein